MVLFCLYFKEVILCSLVFCSFISESAFPCLHGCLFEQLCVLDDRSIVFFLQPVWAVIMNSAGVWWGGAERAWEPQVCFLLPELPRQHTSSLPPWRITCFQHIRWKKEHHVRGHLLHIIPFPPPFFFSHHSFLLICYLGFYEVLLLLEELLCNNIVNGCSIIEYNKTISSSLKHFIKLNHKVADTAFIKLQTH